MHNSKQPKNTIKFNFKSPKLPSEHINATTNTKEKKKIVVQFNNQKQKTIVKNLMDEFNSVQQEYQQKQENTENIVLSQEQSLKNQSIQMKVLSEPIINIDKPDQKSLSDPYKIHLPQSYILAMTGLQEGIKTRQNQIHKLKKRLKQQNSLYQITLQHKQKANKQNRHLNSVVDNLNRQIVFLKETISDVKIQLTNQIKSKGVLQNQLKISQKQASFSKNDNEVLQIKYQKQILTLKNDNQKLQSEIKYKQTIISQTKKDYSLIIAQHSEQKANFQINIQVCRNEMNIILEKLRLTEAKLKEKQALQQKKVLDNMQRQIVINRQILKDVSIQQNLQRNRSKTMVGEKKLSKYNDIQENKRSQISQNHKTTVMKQKYSLSRANRSSSTFKQPKETQLKSNRRQLIGQMRQLLRYQKELVSLNYQMQLLQKEMASKCQVLRRQQLQKQYSRLRRQIQKKEIQILDIKNFLDNPIQRIK